MIIKEDFRARLKKFALETGQNIKTEQADALWERFKYHDQIPIWQALEAMTQDDVKLTYANIKKAVISKIQPKQYKNTEINLETWPEIQKQRMKAITEAIQKGPQALKSLREYQDKGEGIWDVKNELSASKYDCHENCDNGTVFYQDKEGHSYAGTCAICKRGPGKPSPLINPDNMQVIKWGDQRQGG